RVKLQEFIGSRSNSRLLFTDSDKIAETNSFAAIHAHAGPVVAAVKTSPSTVQLTCSSRPTTKSHASPPATNTPTVTAIAVTKLPVRSTVNPVRAGATTPAKLAKPFCRPVHRPAARGPASV